MDDKQVVYAVSIAAKDKHTGSIATKVLFVQAPNFKAACERADLQSTVIEFPLEDGWIEHCMSLKRIDIELLSF